MITDNIKHVFIFLGVVLLTIVWAIYSNYTQLNEKIEKLNKSHEELKTSSTDLYSNVLKIAEQTKKLNGAVNALSNRDDYSDSILSVIEDVERIQETLMEQGLMVQHKKNRVRFVNPRNRKEEDSESDYEPPPPPKRKTKKHQYSL